MEDQSKRPSFTTSRVSPKNIDESNETSSNPFSKLHDNKQCTETPRSAVNEYWETIMVQLGLVRKQQLTENYKEVVQMLTAK